MSAAKQTLCLGRYLVDLPKNATLIGSRDDRYSGYEVTSFTTSRDTFDRALKEKEKKLSETKHKKDPMLLKLSKELKDGKILAYWENDFSDVGYILEAHLFSNHIQHTFKTEVIKDRLSAAVIRLENTIQKFIHRAENELPPQDGFCVQNGFIAGQMNAANGDFVQESTAARFQFKSHPDFYIEVSTDSLRGEAEENLLTRWSKAQGSLVGMFATQMASVQKLRMGAHPVGSLKGEEVLLSLPAEGGGRLHQFTWEVPGKPGLVMEPKIQIVMESGLNPTPNGPRKIQASLSNETAMELFDEIVNSIRLRPITDANGDKPVSATSAVPLGTLVASGQPSPQTGTWRCSERHEDVESGNTRVFKQGEIMPTITLLGKPGLLDSLAGKRPSKPNWPTVWRLVSIEKTP